MFLKMLGDDFHYRSFKTDDHRPGEAVFEDLYLAPWVDGKGALKYVQTIVRMDEIGEGGEVLNEGGTKNRYVLDVSAEGVHKHLAVAKVDEIGISAANLKKMIEGDANEKAKNRSIDKGFAQIADLLSQLIVANGGEVAAAGAPPVAYADEGTYYNEA